MGVDSVIICVQQQQNNDIAQVYSSSSLSIKWTLTRAICQLHFCTILVPRFISHLLQLTMHLFPVSSFNLFSVVSSSVCKLNPFYVSHLMQRIFIHVIILRVLPTFHYQHNHHHHNQIIHKQIIRYTRKLEMHDQLQQQIIPIYLFSTCITNFA